MTTNKKIRLVIAAITVLFVFSCENPMVIAILPDKKKKEQPGILKESIEFTDASAEIAKTYGDPLFTNAVAAAYLGTGAVTYSSSDEAVAVVNAQNGEVTIKGAGETVITAVKAADERYAQAEASYVLTVAKAALTVTADNMAISYDTDVPEYTYAITGFAYSDTKTVITGTPELVCAYAKGSNSGSFPIIFAEENLSAANYDFVYAAGTLSVGFADQAALSIADPGVKAYGDAAFSLSTTGGTGIGKVSYTIVSGGDVIGISGNTATIKKAGSATVKAVKAGSGNYNHAESAAITLTIGKRNLSNASVSVGGTPVYIGSAHTPPPTVTDGGASITASDYTVSGYGNNISVGVATVTITAKSSGNYTGTQSGTFTIGKATLTVSAADKVIAYGAAAPEYTYTITGFVTGENESVISGNAELDCEYAQNDPKGTYPISFTAENFTAANYRFEYEDGELAVGIQAQDALALAIEGDSLAIDDGNITVTYGDANFTLSASGGSGNGVVGYRVLSGTDVIGINSATGEVFIKKAGTATVGARKSSDDEYSRTVADAVTVTVGKRDLTNANVSVSGTFTYTGSEQEPATVTDGGLIGTADYTVEYEENVNAGTATVIVTAADEGNYTGSVTEVFTIGKAVLAVTANNESIVYNDAEPEYAYAITGFVGSDTEAAIVSGEPTLACSYAQGSNVGSYTITVGQGTLTLDSANYEFSLVNGALTVSRKNPVVTWPTGLTAVVGQTLTVVTLPGNGTSTPAGTFSWTAGNSTSVGSAGTQPHSMTFTPSDTANYNTVTQNVNISVSYHLVTFNSNGGSSISNQNIAAGGTVTKPANPTRTFTGANTRFRGWYTDNGTFADEYNFGSPVTGNITLYADWGYRAGDTGPGGGKIFYRSDEGFTMTDTGATAYYLEAASANMSATLAWASAGYTTTSIAGTEEAIGEGRKNTALILAIDAAAPAALACRGGFNNGGSLTDWFLPSKDELYQLYLNRAAFGNFGTVWYWSSSQYSDNLAWHQDFSDGRQYYYYKNFTSSVRAVRAF